jgi:hypothetical protein
MAYNLSLTPPHSLRHPVQESKISHDIEVDKFAHIIPGTPWAGSFPLNVPFGKVDPVIDGLDSEDSKGQQKGKGSDYVNEC